jgi:hypothetical protein
MESQYVPSLAVPNGSLIPDREAVIESTDRAARIGDARLSAWDISGLGSDEDLQATEELPIHSTPSTLRNHLSHMNSIISVLFTNCASSHTIHRSPRPIHNCFSEPVCNSEYKVCFASCLLICSRC